MSRRLLILAALAITAFACLHAGPCCAESPVPQAPACFSWIPHGYGGDMYVVNTIRSTSKGFHGFRVSPQYIGCWSHPLWGWDVNGYYRGPNEPSLDPVMCQLPIGLIYPENTPPMPPSRAIRKVAAPAGR